MYKIGLTGGIGSGKSTVANLFAELGVPIIDTDQIARQVVEPQTFAWHSIINHFGASTEQLLEANTQQINRRYLRELVFKNPQEKKWLEELLHPLIRNEVNRQVDLVKFAYCILVIPLLFENKHDYHLNRVLVVHAAPEQQIKRVMKRDQVKAEQVQQIIAHQVSQAERLQFADDVIENNNLSLNELRSKVLQLHHYYLQLAH